MAVTAGIAAGATVLGSLIGGLFGSSSQSSANQTNREIARETNAQNRELFNQQLAWTEDMWNKTNAYNSPAEVIKRYRAAGVNPALGSEFGTASQPASPNAPTMQGATVQPVDYSWLGDAISTGTNAYFNNNLTDAATKKTINDAQISKVKAELDTKSLKDQLIRIANDSRKSEYEREQARIQMSILDRTQEDAVRQASWQTKIQERQYEQAFNDICESKLRQTSMDIANQYAPRMAEQQLKQYRATVSNLYAAARAEDASAAEHYANEAVALVVKEGHNISNRVQRNMASSLLTKASEEAKQAIEATRQAKATSKQLEARNELGEARVRLLGTEKKKINTYLPGEKRVVNAYKRGVQKGINEHYKR